MRQAPPSPPPPAARMVCTSCGPMRNGEHSRWCECFLAGKLKALRCRLFGHRYQLSSISRGGDCIVCGGAHTEALPVPTMPECKPPKCGKCGQTPGHLRREQILSWGISIPPMPCFHGSECPSAVRLKPEIHSSQPLRQEIKASSTSANPIISATRRIVDMSFYDDSDKLQRVSVSKSTGQPAVLDINGVKHDLSWLDDSFD